LKPNKYIFLYFLFYNSLIFSQNFDCENAISFLTQKEIQIAQLNLHDPDFIPLHYFVSQDIIKELKHFRNNEIPYYSECKLFTFNEMINKYDVLYHSVQQKQDSLAWLNRNVYLIFYEKALYEYQLKNDEDGKYFLDRALQYNPTFTNAILLKLNKLLEEKQFNECLSLLNTLYYETEMNEEQEKQAIKFTDRFYDKLYKTGDSLLKKEHAAEALKFFEILEIFCQNLPTSYCNDDYYHGVLNSKTGIYDSYLAIAKAAEKRGNMQIAAHFYQYAQEYLDNNPHLKHYEPKHKEKNVVILQYEEENKAQPVVIESVAIPSAPSTSSSKEIKDRYDSLVLQALGLCIKEDFSASYKMFTEAKKLEECRCFPSDFRVDLMIRELEKSGIK
jgi:hypothetical protein